MIRRRPIPNGFILINSRDPMNLTEVNNAIIEVSHYTRDQVCDTALHPLNKSKHEVFRSGRSVCPYTRAWQIKRIRRISFLALRQIMKIV